MKAKYQYVIYYNDLTKYGFYGETDSNTHHTLVSADSFIEAVEAFNLGATQEEIKNILVL